jgi:adenylate cyclase
MTIQRGRRGDHKRITATRLVREASVTNRESPIAPEAVTAQLHRIITSHEFDASERNRRFLQYVIEETLAGRTERIKAYSIATSVFGREPSFDPQADPIIRIEASRLRRSLERYYLTAGRLDPIHIDIPKGSYIPTFGSVSGAPGLNGQDSDRRETGSVSADLSNGTPAPLTHAGRRIAIPGAILGILLVLGLAVSLLEYYSPLGASRQAESFSDRGPAILVAPFYNDGITSDPSGLVEGFTREVIVGLNQFNGLFVFGPETSFRYGTGGDSEQSLSNLPIDFVLKGGVTIAQNRFRVSASLISWKSGQYLWSGSFERDLTHGDILRTRELIAERVVQTIAQPYGIIFQEETKKIEDMPPQSLTSYQCVLQFHQYWHNLNAALHETVRKCLERAVVRDPDYSEAWSALAMVYANIPRYGFGKETVTFDPLLRAQQLAQHAVELAPDSVQGYKALHLVYWLMNDVDRSFEAARRGLEVSPNDSEMMADLGGRLCLAGDWKNGYPLVEEAFARNPAQPGLYRIVTFLRLYLDGRYPEALAEAEKANIPSVIHEHVILAMAHAQLGHASEAQAEVSEILKIDPEYGARVVEDLRNRNLHPATIQAVVEGLQKAGLKVTGITPDPET